MAMIQKFTLPIVQSLALITLVLVLSFSALAQSLTAGTVTGTVTDPNNAVVPNAAVTIENAVTGFKRTVNTESDGTFKFIGVPPNTYSLTVTAAGFIAAKQTLNVRTSVPIALTIPLSVGAATESVTVTSASNDVLENVPSSHTDIDQGLINRMPVRSPGSGMSDLVTLSAPGVVAESNGMF